MTARKITGGARWQFWAALAVACALLVIVSAAPFVQTLGGAA